MVYMLDMSEEIPRKIGKRYEVKEIVGSVQPPLEEIQREREQCLD